MAVEVHLGAPNCSRPLLRGRDRQPLHTALHSQPEPAKHRQSGPCASNLFPSRPRAPLPLQAEIFPALCCHLWPSHPRTGLGVPPWSLLYFYLDGTLVCGPASPHRAASSPWVKETTSIPHCPASSPLFYVSQGPASVLGPFTGAQDGAHCAPFTRSCKTFGA